MHGDWEVGYRVSQVETHCSFGFGLIGYLVFRTSYAHCTLGGSHNHFSFTLFYKIRGFGLIMLGGQPDGTHFYEVTIAINTF